SSREFLITAFSFSSLITSSLSHLIISIPRHTSSLFETYLNRVYSTLSAHGLPCKSYVTGSKFHVRIMYSELSIVSHMRSSSISSMTTSSHLRSAWLMTDSTKPVIHCV